MTSRDIPEVEWLEKRERALERDDRQCRRCEKTEAEAESLHVHHNVGVAEGGSHDLENLRTLCQSCHYEHHAEERRNGTLEDIKDIYLKVEAPFFKRRDIQYRLGCSESQTYKKLKKLVERGFLKKPNPGVYARADLEFDHANSKGRKIIVDGSVVKDGEYLGEEDLVTQCDYCGRFFHGEYAERSVKSHLNRCSEYDTD